MIELYRTDSSRGAAIATGATDPTAPAVGPCLGAKRFRVHMRLPAGGGKLDILLGLVANSTLAVAWSFELPGAGTIDDDATALVGGAELFGIVFTNFTVGQGGAAQKPEILVSLVEEGDL